MKQRALIFVLALGPACAPKAPQTPPRDFKNSETARLCAQKDRGLLSAKERQLLDLCLKSDEISYKQRRRDCKKIIYLMEAQKEREDSFSDFIEGALDFDLRLVELAELNRLYLDKKCYEFE